MKLHHLMHVPFEGPGVVSQWAKDNGHEVTITHSYKNEALPHPDEFDFLVIMGGPQSACELEKYPYLQDEVRLIQASVAANKYVLGICLGAQLIGAAFGAQASRSPEKEVGCFSVELTEAGKQDRIFKTFPTSFPSIHWHYDMPGVPSTGAVLASSAGCPVQVVRYAEKVYGLQFHLEFTKDKLQKLVEKCQADLKPSPFTQPPAQILGPDLDQINGLMRRFLDQLVTL